MPYLRKNRKGGRAAAPQLPEKWLVGMTMAALHSSNNTSCVAISKGDIVFAL
jgi:hypothetical protein